MVYRSKAALALRLTVYREVHLTPPESQKLMHLDAPCGAPKRAVDEMTDFQAFRVPSIIDP